MSSREIEVRDTTLEDTALLVDEQPTLVMPVTGEVVDLRNLDEVADALDQVREMKRSLDGFRGLFENVLRLRSSQVGTKTLHLAECDAVVSGGTRPEYDIELLAELLRSAGLPEPRLGDLIETVITYKVKAPVARQLAGANPAYAAALRESRRDVPAAWRVSIKRREK